MKWGCFSRKLFLGMILGSLFTFSPGTLFMLGLVGFTGLLFQGFLPFEDRRFVVSLFLAGFFFRMILSVGMDASMWMASGGRAFHLESTDEPGIFKAIDESRGFFRLGDSDFYTQRSFALARYAKGERNVEAKGGRFQYYGRGGYLYVMALFNVLFGFSPVAVKFVNCFWGALLGPFVYLLGKATFHSAVGRWAGRASAFFPSLVLWSVTNLKDTSLIVLGVVLLLLFFQMMRCRSKRSLMVTAVLFFLAFWGHAGMRSTLLSLSLLGCLGVSFWCTYPMKRTVKILGLGVLLAVAVFFHSAFQQAISFGLFQHLGHAKTFPGVPYFYLPEDFYIDKRAFWPSMIGWNVPFLLGLLRAVLHYLLEPFPWRPGSSMRIPAAPQMAFWMVALLFAVYGTWVVFRWKKWRALPLVLVTAVWTFMGALINGNVGTAFRMRDMVTPFYLILASAGFWFLIQRNLPKRSTG